MALSIRLVVPPASLPVTVADAKAYARVSTDAEDELIGTLIAAAVEQLDGYAGLLGRAIMPQTWEMALDRFQSTAEIRLPLGPVASVASITYADLLGVDQVVEPANYVLDDRPTDHGWIVPVATFGWPMSMDRINAVRVRWVAGTGPTAAIRLAILRSVADWYDNRGAERTLPPSAFAELAPHLRYRI